MIYIANAFSTQMLPNKNMIVYFEEISADEFFNCAEKGYSCMGNKNLAKLLGLEYNKEPIHLQKDDIVLLAQLYGGKLENCNKLPENVEIKFKKIKVVGECGD